MWKKHVKALLFIVAQYNYPLLKSLFFFLPCRTTVARLSPAQAEVCFWALGLCNAAGYVCSHPWPGRSGWADDFVSSICPSHLLCKHWLRRHKWQQQQAHSDLLDPARGTSTFIECGHSVSQVKLCLFLPASWGQEAKGRIHLQEQHRLYCSPKSLNILTS